MRTVRYTSRFRKDYRRERSGKRAGQLDERLHNAVSLLARDLSLPGNYVDHALSGDWKDFRDCHLWPDLVLIYRKPGDDVLELVRLGSHSELSL